jgi:bifunctional enzyme CysN/CysC
MREIIKVINASSLEEVGNGLDRSEEKISRKKILRINRHEVAECILETERPVAFDTADYVPFTSRFVIVDKYEISGGGIITENIEDEFSQIRDKVLLRNFKWESGSITPAMRAERFCQRASMIIITGGQNTNKKIIAKTLEQLLFNNGRLVYYLGIGNILYGVDSDIRNINSNTQSEKRDEHIRRLAEVSNILLETGALLIVTATMLNQEDIELIKTVLSQDCVLVYWVGENVDTDIKVDAVIEDCYGVDDSAKAVLVIKNDLQDKNIIYKP